MNLFELATRGVDLDALPAGRSPERESAVSAPVEFAVPQDLNAAFDAAADEYGVDADVLRAMAYAESRFRPDVMAGQVKSRTGATGLMQFMPETAKRFGIDPTDPVESIFGAAAYMRANLEKFDGDYDKAVAAYNWGENRQAYGRPDWKDQLPQETRGYLDTVFGAADELKLRAPAQPESKTEAAPKNAPQTAPETAKEPAPIPERTWGEAFGDTTKSLAQGLLDVGSLPGVAYSAVTGDWDTGYLKAIRGTQEVLQDQKSAEIQARNKELQSKLSTAEGWREKLAVGGIETLKDPTLLFDTLARSAPGMFAGGGVGRGAGAAANAAGNAAFAKALGTGSELAARIAVTAKNGAGVLARATATGTAAGIQGASVASDTYDELSKLPVEAFKSEPEWSALEKQHGAQQAKEILAGAAANRALLMATGASVLSMKLVPGGDAIEKMFLPKALKGEAAKAAVASTSLLTRPMGKGMDGGLVSKAVELIVKGSQAGALESVSEGVEEGTGAIAKGLELSRAGQRVSLSEMAGEAYGQGAAAGLVMGKVAGMQSAYADSAPTVESQPKTPTVPSVAPSPVAPPVQPQAPVADDLPAQILQAEQTKDAGSLPTVEQRDTGTVMLRGGDVAAVSQQLQDAGIEHARIPGGILVGATGAQAAAQMFAPPTETQPNAPTPANPGEETTPAPSAQGAPEAAVVLQNRNRSTPSSVAQMRSIAANPDYGRLGFSRDFANGAPVVAGGAIPAAQLGRQDTATASNGRRIPVQYAVVDAADVLTSNRVDGSPNVEYGNEQVQAVRAVAGNGRIAGLQAAYQANQAAQYTQELAQDSALHGVDPRVIAAMKNPVLVRVMPQSEITADIGDLSNTTGGLSLSAVEQANNDANRVDLAELQFSEDGSLTTEAVRQFVRAMPQAEQGGLIDTTGQPSKQAIDRLQAAVFAKAYGNEQLIRLFAQAQDPEARNILSALSQVANKMARLEGAGALDIRDVVAQAAEIAVNAKREGKAMAIAAQQMDMAADPDVSVVLDLFASNMRRVKAIVEALGNAADFAYTEANKPDADMFGEVPRASRTDILNTLRPENERGSQEALENAAGREPVAVDAVGQANEPAGSAALAEAQASRPAEDAAAQSGQVNERGAEYSVRQQFSLFGPEEGDQLQLFIDSGPVSSQAGAGAVEAQREAVAALADMESTASILAKSLSRDFAARQRVSLVGQKISTSEDLAVLAQVYRDPRFETFRVIFTDKNDRVVSQVGLTSRLPASTSVIVGDDISAYLNDLAAAAKQTGATGYYMLHNHPSGRSNPSQADKVITNEFYRKMPGLTFKSHIVIDTNEYSAIAKNGTSQTITKDFGQPQPFVGVGAYAGTAITGPETVVQIAKNVQVDSNAVTLIATDTQFKVRAVTTIPAAHVGKDVSVGMRKLRIARALMGFNSSNVFAVGRTKDALKLLNGIVVDAIHVDAAGGVQSLASSGLMASQPHGAFPSARRTRVSPDTSAAFNYLRFDPSTLQSAGARAVQEQQDGLTSYTAEDIAQRQDERATAEATAKRADADAERAASAARQSNEIAQRSVAAADSFELGQSGEDNLSGQVGLKFSKRAKAETDEKNLIIQHNLTAENLLHAVKMGGIAVPSLAVTTKTEPLTGFGEITLIGSVSMADPKGYAGTKVFGADIYSPRYPSITLEFTLDARKRGEAMIREGMEATDTRHIAWSEVERDGARELERQPAVMWNVLKEAGIEPTIVRTQPKPLDAEIMPFAEDTRPSYELAADPDFADAVYAAHRSMLVRAYGGDAEANTYADAEIAKMKATAAERGRSQLVNSYASGVQQYQRDLRESGRIDKSATTFAMGNQIRDAGLDRTMKEYAQQIITDLNPNERIFQGYTNSGNRKYIPHTLENVVKILKKELRGGESFNYGVGTLRAKFTPQFKTVAEIRKAKNRLISSDDFDKVKDEINTEFLNMADAMSIPGETLSAIMEDAAKMGVTRAAAQYDVDMGGNRATEVAEFMTKLRELPTAYFEAKILRDVDLAEFSAAVVPSDVSQKVKDALASRGVNNVFTYERNNDADRKRAIQDAAESKDGLLFSKGTNSPRTPISTIAQAITKAYGNALTRLQGKGLVTLTQTENEALQAAAAERAKVNGTSEAVELKSLRASMNGGTVDVKRSADGQLQGFFDPATGKSFLISDNLTAETALGVFMHEVGIHMANDGTLQPLFDRASAMVTEPTDPFLQRVKDRMDAAGETSGEEAAAYIVEAYENDRENAPSSVVQWVKDFIADVRAWLFSKGVLVKADQLTVADIAAIARANARTLANGVPVDAGSNGTRKGGGLLYSIQRDKQGMPVIEGDGVTLQYGQPTDRLEFIPTDDSHQMLRFAVSTDANPFAGYVDALFQDGKPVALYDIFMEPDQRKGGSATKAVKALLDASPDGKLDISNIVTEAQEFWAKMGIPTQPNQPKGYAYDGTITQESFAASDAGKNAGTTRSDLPRGSGVRQAQDGRGRAGRSEESRAGTDGIEVSELTWEQAQAQGLKFSKKQAQQQALDLATPQWQLPDATKTDRLIYELQDGRIDLKRAQEAIAKAGRTITEGFDARLAETLMPGRVAYRTETFLKVEVQPLLEAMARNKVSQDELSDYLLARHAPERNAQISKINPDMPDGGAGTNSQGVLMTTQAARDHIAGLTSGKRTALELLARQVDALTQGTREMLVREGLEKQETIDAWTGAYQHYVPLFKDEAMETPGHPIGSGFSVTGSASKRSTGSSGEVTNMVAHILMQREAAITRAEKNRVAMSLYGLALTHPNAQMWTTVRPSMSDAQIEAELQRMGVDPVEAQSGMQGAPTIRAVDPVTGLVVDRPNPLYKRMDNALVVKVNGEDRVILFNKANPRALRMVQNLKNQDGVIGLDMAGSVVGRATRYLAAINTQYNPAFGMVNIVRDLGGAMVNLTDTPLAGKQARVLGDSIAAMQGIARDLRGDSKRTPWSDLWKQFQEDGGRTGYRDLFIDPYKRAESVQGDLDKLSKAGKLTPGAAAHAVLDLLDDFNTTLENGVRLSAYKAALDMGMSRSAAARVARELTLDFNRKGRTGRELGPLYAFFNASIQGTARTVQALKGPAGKRILAGGLSLGVVQALMLAAAGFDDDEIPEFIKARAFIIPMPGKQYIAIPLQFGLNALPNTGRVVTELLMSGGREWQEKTFDAVGELAGSFNPMGGGNIFTASGALKTIAPTVLDPLIEMGTNTGFSGQPIAKERMPWDTRPGFTMGRESTQRAVTGQVYVGISQAINRLTFGDDYTRGLASPAPEHVRYVFTTVGGGVFRELEKALSAAVLTAKGEDLKAREVPLGSRFAGEVDDEQVQRSRYYKNHARMEKLEAKLKGLAKDGKGEELRQFVLDEPAVKLYEANNQVAGELARLNKLAVENITDKEALKRIDAARTNTMRVLNDKVREMEKR